jgi:polysaccharide biosynthesis protein PslG
MNTMVCTSTVANIQDWADFVTALVTRYKGKIQMYELWNEPDQKYFTGTVDQMVVLTNQMYSIVRSLDPQALIAAPSATSTVWLDTYWAAGGVTTIDIATTHDYPNPDNPVAEVICSFRSVPLKAVMAKYGVQVPIWDTEGSWGESDSLSDPDLQAAYASRNSILHWACGVQRFYWYAWDGGGSTWGLLWTRAGGVSEAGVAYENAYVWLNGASMPNSCLMNGAAIPPAPDLYTGVYTCDLTRPNGYEAQIVWDTQGTSTFTAPDQFTQYRDVAGNTYAIPSDHQVTIGYKPILLEN